MLHPKMPRGFRCWPRTVWRAGESVHGEVAVYWEEVRKAADSLQFTVSEKRRAKTYTERTESTEFAEKNEQGKDRRGTSGTGDLG